MSPQQSKGIALPHRQNLTSTIAFRFACILLLQALILSAQSSAQQVTELYAFTGGSDGWDPGAPMIAGPDGSLYGTTEYGGIANCSSGYGCGTVYRLSPSGDKWAESTLYQFRAGKDGLGGFTTLTLDSAGNLYGPTWGGTPKDAVFQLTPGAPGKPWHFRVLHEFTGLRDGDYPLSPVFLDKSGAIYGASQEGGLSGKGCNQQFGCGAIYQLMPRGPDTPWQVNVLYEFQGANDGGNPTTMIMDKSGVIYGTTAYGGLFNKNCPLGCGVVFELFPSHSSAILPGL